VCHDSSVKPETAAPTLDAARVALERGDFAVAREVYERLVEEECTAEALDGLGQALWFLCEIDEGIAWREEAYAAFRRQGDVARAAAIALWLVVEHALTLGNEVAAGGWLARAERLLAGAPLCPAHAELEVRRGQRCADPEQATRHFERAVEIGRRLGDVDSEVRGLNQLGFLKVTLGDVDGGMALLDETMAAAMGGEVRDLWAIGSTCCSLMFACERMSDLKRAAQWSRVVIGFTERRRFVPFSPLCRAVYAGVLISQGDWRRAEIELLAALDAYRGFGRALAAYPLARLVELRMRQGRFEEAEQLIGGWEGHPELRSVGIALLLERGETELASAKLEHALDRVGDGPSAAPFLALLVRARLLQDDLDGARVAADRLLALAGRLNHDHLLALAGLAAGQVHVVAREEAAACARLEAAIESFSRLDMPFEEARAHLELATAIRAREPELAVAEARTALEIFERLGASSGADRAAAALRSLGASGRSAPKRPGRLTRREREILALLELGLSNKEIAARLYITPKTAGHHVSRVLAKLGVRNRAEAAAYAARERAERPVSK
jgi:DNA-binding NarL/FixJ family response regulator